jgi:hypothetical protein
MRETGLDGRAGACPSELELDRWALAGRPSEHAVARHARGCPACAGRLEQVAECEALVAPGVLEARVEAVYARAAAQERGRWARWRRLMAASPLAVGALAAALVAMLVLASWPRPEPESGEQPAWKVVGEVALQVLVGQEVRAGGATLAPGALLTFRVTTARPGFLALVSLEQGGRASRVWPAQGPQAAAVARGLTLVQGGVAAARGAERVFVLFDQQPFAIQDALEAVLRGVGTEADLARADGRGVSRVAASWWFHHAGGTP